MKNTNSATPIAAESQARVIADLGQTVLFKGVSHSLMTRFLARANEAFFQKGEVLLSPDQTTGRMYLLLSGSVRVHLDSLDSDPFVYLGPGECVGEMSLFDGSNPSAYVIADQETATMVVDSQLLWDMINESHDVARNLLYLLSKRIRSGNAAVNYNQALHRKAQQDANSDALTGVNNRRWLEQLLLRFKGRTLDELAPLSVIMLDVDHFKQFNDQFGHQVGDEVLKLVAKAMQSSLRPNDMVARYGGEEFLILLPKTKLPNCIQVAERLRLKVAGTPVIEQGREIPGVTISLGVAQWQADMDLEALIGEADEALYQAKNKGRNQVCRADKAL